MAVLKCEACGAPLATKNGVLMSICEYCETKNILSDTATIFTQQETIHIEGS